jgi:Tol biopolymer transport system component
LPGLVARRATARLREFRPADAALNGIYTVRSSDGGGLTRVTSNPGGDDLPGDYAPNGRRLVFARSDPAGNPVALYTVREDGRDLRQITPAGTRLGGSDGDWSPRGNEIEPGWV